MGQSLPDCCRRSAIARNFGTERYARWMASREVGQFSRLLRACVRTRDNETKAPVICVNLGRVVDDDPNVVSQQLDELLIALRDKRVTTHSERNAAARAMHDEVIH